MFSDEAVTFVGRHRAEPFFLYVAYNAALPPHQPPGRPDDIRDGATWWDGTRADYIGVVEALDAGVGRVLGALDTHGIADNTLVAFSYDHGGRELSRMEPLFNGFRTLWEGGIRVPLLLRWPERLPAGATSAQLVSLMDLMPTVLAATMTPFPDVTLDGIDLLPILEGGAREVDRSLYWRTDDASHRQQAARRGSWKYMQDGTMEMLFAIDDDPAERRNLAYRFPGVLRRMQEAVRTWRRELGG